MRKINKLKLNLQKVSVTPNIVQIDLFANRYRF